MLTAGEAADRASVTRQRVSQMVDLERLRRPGGPASGLARTADDLLGPVGALPLDTFREALTVRLPVRASANLSAEGYSRLAALLLDPAGRVADAGALRFALRAPWTPDAVRSALAVLSSRANWPPAPRRDVEQQVWDALGDALQTALVRRGADAAMLLDALLAAAGEVRVDRLGGLYTPPVPLADALARLRPTVRPASAEALLDEAASTWEGVDVPDDPTDALRAAGFVCAGDLWVDPDRHEAAAPAPVPVVDAGVPRQVAGPQAAVVDALAASADRGGFRVVTLPPGEAHRLGRRLADWLGETLGPGRVRYVDVDRALVQALKDADHWKFVPYLENQPAADWRWAAKELHAALEALVADAVPGRVTILGQPALLGPLGLMDWLGGFYERARGGRHGLVVLALPGGIHDGRVRLNERFTLACTPDMAAVYLEAPRA
jgi:hypothetical protein